MKCTVSLKVRIPFYVKWYIYSCAAFARLFNLNPDIDKIVAKSMKHTKITTEYK